MFRFGLLAGVVGTIVGFGAWSHYSKGLPAFNAVDDYQPKQISRVYAADGTPIAEFFEERRTVVTRAEIPEVLVQAVLAAEDADFFRHEGLDYVGMLRALYNSARAGHIKGSGSTITQQTVKNILLTHERSFRRKAREIILTRRLETRLSKDDILTIYLNTIYLGHGRYGVQEAARFYFDKDVSQIDLNEAAILAGVIQSPERHSPRKHPEAARRRRAYVLGQMVSNDFITPGQAERLRKAPLGLQDPRPNQFNESRWFVERVRKQLLGKLFESALAKAGIEGKDPGKKDPAIQEQRAALWKAVRKDLDTKGYAIQTTLDLRRQRAAVAALRAGIRAVDARQKYDAPIQMIVGPREVAKWRRKRKAALKDKPPVAKRVIPARVEAFKGAQGYVLDLGVGKATLRLEAAKRLDPRGKLEVGAVYPVTIRRLDAKHPERMRAVLANGPQGAVVVLDPQTRDVLALVGGWDYTDYPFDRASLATRQPGSAFKPFVWGAAYQTRRYAPATVMVDAPETWQIQPGKWWTPKNYTGKYEGPISLRMALAKSKNSIAVKLAHDVGLKQVRDFAESAGLKMDSTNNNLSMALGSSGVTPLALANAYCTLGNDGRRAQPRFITSVSDPKGAPVIKDLGVVDPSDSAERTLDPGVVWILRDTMRSVVTHGSGRKLKDFPRSVLGKTGTSNKAVDTWFVGLLPDVAVVAWLGFDEHRSLGRKESGGRAAVPVVKAYLEQAETAGPDWPPPPKTVVRRLVDPATGLLAPEGADGKMEVFLAGTEPSETATPEGEVDAENFFFDAYEDAPGEGDPAGRQAPKVATPAKPLPGGTGPAVRVPNIGVSKVPNDLRPVAPMVARPARRAPSRVRREPAVESPPDDGGGDLDRFDEDRP
jgi:penicillin-binding protein 1A